MGVLRRVTIHQLRVPKKEKQWTEAAMILGFLLTVLWLWYGSVVFVVLGGLVFLLFIYGYLEAKTKTRKKKVSVVTTEVLKKPKVQQKPKVHLARNEKGRFIKRQASEGLSYERTRWTKEKYSPFSENFAATIAQTLIRIYNQNKLPNYYNSFYLPLGLRGLRKSMECREPA